MADLSRLTSRLSLIGGLTVLIAVVIGMLGWHAYFERPAILAAARLQSQGYARALGEHAGSALAEADRILQDVVLEISDKGGIERMDEKTLHYIVRRQGGDTPQIGALFVVDRQGTMIVNSNEFPAKHINVSDREYFKYNTDTAGPGLFISRPLISRMANKWRFTLTRPLPSANGSFAGLAAVAFDIDFFDRFYSSLGIGQRGSMRLIRNDGYPLISQPFAEGSFDVNYRQTQLFREYLGTSPSGTFRQTTGPEAPSISSFYRLTRFPVIAVVSLHENDILAPWKRKIAYEAASTTALCIVILLLLQLLFRHLNKLESTQTTLREQQSLVRMKAAQIDAATDAILLATTDGRLEHMNNALCHMTGFSVEDFQGKSLYDLEPGEWAKQSAANMQLVRDRGEATFESAYLTAGGNVLPVEVHARVMDLEGATRILSIVRDISDRKRSDRREQTRLRLLEEMATGAELRQLLDHIVRFVEQERPEAVCSLLLTYEHEAHLHVGAAPTMPDLFQQIAEGGEESGWFHTVSRNRRRSFADDLAPHHPWDLRMLNDAGLRSCWSEPIISSQGECLGIFITCHRNMHVPDGADISLVESAAHLAAIALERVRSEEHKARLEAQLHQAQKMEAIGQLAGGIAHDFNNLLTPIIGYAHLIQKQVPDSDALASKVNGIVASAFKARDLTQQLLSFGRKQRLEMRSVDLNAIIVNMKDMLRRTIRENIAITFELPSTDIPIWADRIQIEQILLNLAVNAQDAISGNGSISIETGHVMLDDEYCRLHPGVQPGSFALLSFRDNGSGMDETVLRHIFEPFYTTKQVGRGTGLGLATVYGIIKQHEGHISVNSRPDHGSTFSIYLPLSKEEPHGPETLVTAEAVENAAAVGKAILVVEDNDMVRNMTVELLESAGYRVLAAGAPSAALTLAETHGRDIGLVVSDVVMPEMSGPDMFAKLSVSLPDLRVLFISGYATDLFVHNGTLEEETEFLQKPFTAEKFLDTVRLIISR